MAPDPASRYDEAVAWLDGHINYERVMPTRRSLPSLEQMTMLATYLGNPEAAYPCIHLTGTNGKGSTSTIATTLLVAMGLSVGTYTSPDLERLNERIALNAQPIADEDLVEALDQLRLVVDVLDEPPTRFELLTMAAFVAFADAAVDVAVVEVGMGGTWDCTNIIDGVVSVVTNVELDHVEVLGPTRADIARDKAGIFRPGAVAVLGESDDELADLLRDRAASVGVASIVGLDHELLVESNDVAVGGRLVTITTPFATYDEVFLSLHGPHQARNAALALAAVEGFFGRALPDEVVRQAFGVVAMPARLEVLGRSPLVVVDGAHNVAGATALADALADGFAVEGRTILVTGMLRGRDARALLAALLPDGIATVVATTPPTPRAQPAADVAEAARSLGHEVLVVDGVAAAVERALTLAGDGDLVLVAGSLYVAGEARPVLRRLLRP